MDYRGLTIGDWLLDKEEGFARRVVQVTDDAFDGCGAGVILENGMDYEECEPIPLTAEILEKNGFEHKHDKEPIKRQYWIINVGGGSIKVKVNRSAFLFNITGLPFREGYYNPTFNAHIQYVHELQHASRLCGLNELADNFKV